MLLQFLPWCVVSLYTIRQLLCLNLGIAPYQWWVTLIQCNTYPTHKAFGGLIKVLVERFLRKCSILLFFPFSHIFTCLSNKPWDYLNKKHILMAAAPLVHISRLRWIWPSPAPQSFKMIMHVLTSICFHSAVTSRQNVRRTWYSCLFSDFVIPLFKHRFLDLIWQSLCSCWHGNWVYLSFSGYQKI